MMETEKSPYMALAQHFYELYVESRTKNYTDSGVLVQGHKCVENILKDTLVTYCHVPSNDALLYTHSIQQLLKRVDGELSIGAQVVRYISLANGYYYKMLYMRESALNFADVDFANMDTAVLVCTQLAEALATQHKQAPVK